MKRLAVLSLLAVALAIGLSATPLHAVPFHDSGGAVLVAATPDGSPELALDQALAVPGVELIYQLPARAANDNVQVYGHGEQRHGRHADADPSTVQANARDVRPG